MTAPRTVSSRLVTRINQALAAMGGGQTLHQQHHEGRPRWSLPKEQSVAPQVAANITTSGCPHHHKCVRRTGQRLFPDMPGQARRLSND